MRWSRFFGLLEHVEVVLEVLLVEKRRSVQALELLVVGIALPVGAGDLHELEGADFLRAGNVGAFAQIDKVAVTVDGDLGIGGQVVDVLGFELLVLEYLLGLVAGNDLAHERFVLLDDFPHLGLDCLEVVGGYGLVETEIVEEAVVSLRTEGNLRAGEEFLNGLGHDMRSRMAQDAKALGRAIGDDLDMRAIGEGRVEPSELAVNLAGDGGLGQSAANGSSTIRDCRSLFELSG